MEKAILVETLENFKREYNNLVMLLHDVDHEKLPKEFYDNYPFEISFDDLNINSWIDDTVKKLKQELAEERQQLFMKIIDELENRYWDYSIINDRIDLELGNEHYQVFKYDYIALKELYDEILGW